MKYKKKPVVIEAEQWAPYAVSDFLSQANLTPIDSDTDWRCQGCGNRASLHMNCPTLEGWHIVCPGDYIIKGVKGEFYPCKPDVFEATYEPVKEERVNMKKNLTTVCNKCGKEAPINNEMSNKNWIVYDTSKPCDCGGQWKIKLN